MPDLALAMQKLLADESTMNSKLICDFINLEIKIGIAKSIETSKKELGNLDFLVPVERRGPSARRIWVSASKTCKKEA
eukprot:15354723-Ditylum_brightwellii.AAC.1